MAERLGEVLLSVYIPCFRNRKTRKKTIPIPNKMNYVRDEGLPQHARDADPTHEIKEDGRNTRTYMYVSASGEVRRTVARRLPREMRG